MNRFALLAAVLTSTILSAHGQPSALRQAVVLTNVTVIDATGAAPKPGMTVVMTGDRIATIDYAIRASEASDAGQKSIEHLNGIQLEASARETELRNELNQAAARA